MRGTFALALGLILIGGCAQSSSYEQAICVLIDVSGTYAAEKAEVVKLLKREVLPSMIPGDTLLVISIDSQSYEKENVEVMATLEERPSRANAQKLALSKTLDAFAREPGAAPYTDIPGAMMLGSEYLREIPSGSRVMLIFSDLATDLPPGSRRKLGEREFEGIEVIALNVKRLESDARDPGIFRSRLADWEKQVTAARAGSWRTVLDPEKLPGYLQEIRSS